MDIFYTNFADYVNFCGKSGSLHILAPGVQKDHAIDRR